MRGQHHKESTVRRALVRRVPLCIYTVPKLQSISWTRDRGPSSSTSSRAHPARAPLSLSRSVALAPVGSESGERERSLPRWSSSASFRQGRYVLRWRRLAPATTRPRARWRRRDAPVLGPSLTVVAAPAAGGGACTTSASACRCGVAPLRAAAATRWRTRAPPCRPSPTCRCGCLRARGSWTRSGGPASTTPPPPCTCSACTTGTAVPRSGLLLCSSSMHACIQANISRRRR